MKRILSMALVLIMVFSISAVSFGESEPFGRMMDMQVKIGDKVYTFADTVDGAEAQGIRFVSSKSDIKAGYWQKADNGWCSFKVLVDAANREKAKAKDLYVCGYDLNSDDCPDAVLAQGIQLGKTTAEEIFSLFGTPNHDGTGLDEVYYHYFMNNRYLNADFYFESEKKDAVLKSVKVISSIPYAFGVGVSESAGVQKANLPDPSSFNFDQFILDGKFYEGKLKAKDLLDNGWRLDARVANEKMDAQSDGLLVSEQYTLFNGIGMIRPYLYNPAKIGKCKPADANVYAIAVSAEDDTEIILVNGLGLGSSFEDVVATFGTNYKEREEDDYIRYDYTVANCDYSFRVIEGTVVYISISP